MPPGDYSFVSNTALLSLLQYCKDCCSSCVSVKVHSEGLYLGAVMLCELCGEQWSWGNSERMSISDPSVRTRLATINLDLVTASTCVGLGSGVSGMRDGHMQDSRQ